MGTPLAVAKLLDVKPQLVYRWMAELERPSDAHLGVSRSRLEQVLDAAVQPTRVTLSTIR